MISTSLLTFQNIVSLLLRVGFDNAPLTSIDNNAPLLTQDNHVFIRALVGNENDSFEGHLYEVTKDGMRSDLILGDQNSAMDLTWNHRDNFLNFSLLSVSQQRVLGIYNWIPQINSLQELYSSKAASNDLQEPIDGMTAPSSNKNSITLRVDNHDDNHRILINKVNNSAEVTKLLEDGDDHISYIFTPRSNSAGQTALKLRYGKAFHVSDEEPDQIVFIDSLQVTKIIAQDRDYNPVSNYLQISHLLSLNEKGDITFLAKKVNNDFVLLLYKNKENELEEIALPPNSVALPFSPSLNDSREIAIMLRENKVDKIYIYRNSEWIKAAQTGDILNSDRGLAFFAPHSVGSPTFHGGLSLNNAGSVSFLCSLRLQATQENIGTGVILIEKPGLR